MQGLLVGTEENNEERAIIDMQPVKFEHDELEVLNEATGLVDIEGIKQDLLDGINENEGKDFLAEEQQVRPGSSSINVPIFHVSQMQNVPEAEVWPEGYPDPAREPFNELEDTTSEDDEYRRTRFIRSDRVQHHELSDEVKYFTLLAKFSPRFGWACTACAKKLKIKRRIRSMHKVGIIPRRERKIECPHCHNQKAQTSSISGCYTCKIVATTHVQEIMAGEIFKSKDIND